MVPNESYLEGVLVGPTNAVFQTGQSRQAMYHDGSITVVQTLMTSRDFDLFVKAAYDGDEGYLLANLGIVQIDCEDENGDTALIAATIAGRLPIVRFLLDRGANVNHSNKFGFTALLWAAEHNHVDIVDLLLSRGANVHHKESEGYTALAVAAKAGHAPTVKLLLSYRADIKVRNLRDDTALLLAAAKGREEVVNILLNARSDPNVANREGASPLLMAAWGASLPVARALVAANADVNFRNQPRGDTPLILAGYRGAAHVVEWLVSQGARADITNTKGTSVYSFKKPEITEAVQRGLEAYAMKFKDHDDENTYGNNHHSNNDKNAYNRASDVPSKPSSDRYLPPAPAPARGALPRTPVDAVRPPTNQPASNHNLPSHANANASGSNPSRLPVNAVSPSPSLGSNASSNNTPAYANANGSANGSANPPRTASNPIEAFMEEEFSKIVGMDTVKDQLRTFYKKVQLDKIREKQLGKRTDKNRLYHMIFMGPPGTGKTTMAKLVAKVMLKMGLLKTDNVVMVNNALDLIAGYVGQTPAKVDAKVKEAEGGVLFIDEAYSIVKKDAKDTFGREAIDTIMKHMDPPSCVFILAGYEREMNLFLDCNEGLTRRIPYRYHFQPYSPGQMGEILKAICRSKDEDLEDGCVEACVALLERNLTVQQRETQNAGLVNNWISFAQVERDDRIDLEDAKRNPDLASLLLRCDFEAALPALRNMAQK